MRSLWPQLAAWIDSGDAFALATVTAVSGSAPRAPGSCMAIEPARSRFLGSVSSGCLDAEVVEAASATLADGTTRRLRFGPDGKPPWSDGLTCGGWIDVSVHPWWGCHPRGSVAAMAPLVRQWLAEDKPGVILTDGQHHCAIADESKLCGDVDAFDGEIASRAWEHLRDERPPMEWEAAGRTLFVNSLRPRPRLILVGAVDVADRLVTFARAAGYATVVIDPRRAYAVADRFISAPDQLRQAWPAEVIATVNPGPRDAAVTLSHDPKVDDPALLALLETRCGYIGALGSQRSHAARLDRLGEAGATNTALARIQGPAGIHLGTPNAAGIALGIMAGVAQWQATQERQAQASANASEMLET